MKVQSIQNYFFINSAEPKRNQNPIKTNMCYPVIQQGPACDTVCFGSYNCGDAKKLKELLKYGVIDMYTGKWLIAHEDLETKLNSGTFNKPLKELLQILIEKENVYYDTDLNLLQMLKKIAVKNPEIKLNEALQRLKPEQQKPLVNIQQSIFDDIIFLSCDLPQKVYIEILKYMDLTDQRISSKKVRLPFSEKEFIYKLERIREEIKSKNKTGEIFAINRLIRSAKLIFDVDNLPKKKRGKLSREEKLKYQMQPDVIKKNSTKIKCLRDLFDNSVLKNNKEIQQIFDSTTAKIHGHHLRAPFRRKEFVHDLKQILRKVKDKSLVAQIIKTAHRLPTSKECTSAFIVKYANDSNNKIGFSLLKDYVGSIEHLHATINGGKDIIANYGLCSTYINRKRTSIPFDDWCRMHPEIYINCQKSVDRLIELYNQGIFKKVGLSKKYLYDFANTIKELSPKEKPLILDLRNIKD